MTLPIESTYHVPQGGVRLGVRPARQANPRGASFFGFFGGVAHGISLCPREPLNTTHLIGEAL